MKATEAFARFITQTRFEDIPSKVVFEAKKVFLDCLGITVGGSLEPAGKIITGFVQTMGGNPDASVVQAGFKTSVLNAALANGVIAHALDFDEGGHPVLPLSRSVAVQPAVLALGEWLGASGKDVLLAYIIGFDLISKVSYGMSAEHHYEWGWQTTGTVCALGAAAGAAKILGLNMEQTLRTLGIAGSGAGGLRQNNGTMTKPLHGGNAARNGVQAALLSQRGFTGTDEVLEGRYGFCQCFCGSEGYDLNKMTENLGKTYDFATPGIGIKRYPACADNHPSIDAMFNVMKEQKFSLDQVDRIECAVHKEVLDHLVYLRPQTVLEGKFSLNYCIAVALADGKVGLKQFTEEKLRDPNVKAWMEKIHLVEHPEQKGQPPKDKFSEVTVRLKDGRVFSSRVKIARGRPANPLDYEEVVSKFKDCAGRVLPDDKVESVLQKVEHLEDVGTISELTDVLRERAIA